jgi:hypothetical protein
MKQVLTLKTPITINGKRVKTLTYDTDEITALQFTEAESHKLKSAGNKGNFSGAFELDYALHLYLGFAAVIAVNPDFDYTDLERIKGADVTEVIKIGRNFIISPSEEPSGEATSEEPSEDTPSTSTQAS